MGTVEIKDIRETAHQPALHHTASKPAKKATGHESTQQRTPKERSKAAVSKSGKPMMPE